MSGATAPPYTIGANLGWFAVLFLLASVTGSFVASSVAFYIRAPTLPLLALAGAFAFATWIASDRFAERRGADVLTRRVDLAIGYVIVAAALTLSLPVIAVFSMIVLGGTRIGPEASHNLLGMVFGALLATFVGIIVNYVIAWLIIGRRRTVEKTKS